MTGGYAYQKYKYSDDQFNGYTNTIPFPGTSTANSSQSYLDGWNANIPYNANIFYLLMSYKFDTPPLPIAQLKAPERRRPPRGRRPRRHRLRRRRLRRRRRRFRRSRSTRRCCSTSTRRC